jgi:hypothetical protein
VTVGTDSMSAPIPSQWPASTNSYFRTRYWKSLVLAHLVPANTAAIATVCQASGVSLLVAATCDHRMTVPFGQRHTQMLLGAGDDMITDPVTDDPPAGPAQVKSICTDQQARVH